MIVQPSHNLMFKCMEGYAIFACVQLIPDRAVYKTVVYMHVLTGISTGIT